VPAEAPAGARAATPTAAAQATAGPEAELMRLQHTAGNKAVAGMMATVQTLPFFSNGSSRDKAAKAGQPTKAQPPAGGLPKVPSIAAHASGVAQGGSFGGHASVYLAVPFGDTLEYVFIDLVMDREAGKKAIDIRMMDLKSAWPGPSTSTTWNITPEGAKKAWTIARMFQLQKRKYSYNYLGIGYRAYNCALFAQKILEAAGVKRTAGIAFSTPLEVALGRNIPKLRQREKKQKGPAPIPAQYGV